jgi:hypothetical protein
MERGIRIRTVILLWLLLSGVSGIHSQSCLPEGITFTTQSQIDSFPILYPTCTEIEGDVLISGSDIKSLTPLSLIQAVKSDLSIRVNDSLSSLSGLENLLRVGGFLYIEYNPLMQNLNGLDGLEVVGQDISISANDGLISFNGLWSMDSIYGRLRITYNSAIVDLSGLENIEYVGTFIMVQSNSQLINLSGLSGISELNA